MLAASCMPDHNDGPDLDAIAPKAAAAFDLPSPAFTTCGGGLPA